MSMSRVNSGNIFKTLNSFCMFSESREILKRRLEGEPLKVILLAKDSSDK